MRKLFYVNESGDVFILSKKVRIFRWSGDEHSNPSIFNIPLILLQVPYVPEGLEAIIFTADGDMRQALNNLQATNSGFGFVNQDNVFKVSA